MRLIFFKNIAFIILILISGINIFSQISRDSLEISIDSLFQREINPEKYVKSASKYYQSESESPVSTKLITSNEIRRYGYQSLTDLLRTIGGFYINDNRKYERLGIRGFDRPNDFNNRILVLLDGHRLNLFDGASVGNDLGIDMMNLDGVEIIRGPGSALYGTNAMFAVINLISKQHADFSDPEVKISFGSNNSKGIAINSGGKLTEDLSLNLNVNYADSKGEDIYFPEFDKPETNNGLSTNLDFENYYGVKGILNYKDLQLSAFSTYRKKGHPTASFFSVFNDFSQVIDQTTIIEAKYTYKMSFDKFFTFNTYYDYYNHSGEYHIAFSWFDDKGWIKNKFESVGGNVQFIWDILPNSRLTSGVEYRHDLKREYILQTATVDFTNVNSKEKNFSLYIQNEYQVLHNLSLYFGVRRDDYFNGVSAISPRISANYLLGNNHVLKLLYGSAFRKPNVYEKYYEIPTLFKRNPDLKPEKIETIEFVWESDVIKFLKTSVSAYHYNVINLIDQKFNGEDSHFRYVNIGKVRTTGFEVSGELEFNKDFGGYLRYSYQKAKDGNSKDLTSSPDHLLKSGIHYSIPGIIHLAFEMQYESERLTVYETETDSFLYSTLFLDSDFNIGGFRFSLLVKNLFNASIKLPGGFQDTQLSIPQRGRIFSINFSYGID